MRDPVFPKRAPAQTGGPGLDEAGLRALALRPFQVIESLGLPSAYERSFKLERGAIVAQRYMLAVDVASTGAERLMAICRGLEMPAQLLDPFRGAIGDAGLALFGFEGSEQGGVFKAYLEFKAPGGSGRPGSEDAEAPYLLHTGFKWRAHPPHDSVTTLYRCQPGLTAESLRERVDTIYRCLPRPVGRGALMRMIDRSLQLISPREMLFLDVGEAEQACRGFDINLYATALQVGDFLEPISEVARGLGVDEVDFERLMRIVSPKRLGHLSAGLSRGGSEYLTVYFEP